jgi:hypothetical protein
VKELVVLGGFSSLGLGIYLFWSSLNFYRQAIRVEGKVIGLRGGAIVSNTYPTVSFTTIEGKKIVFSSESGSNVSPKIGDSIKIYYQPDDPQKARIASFMPFWMLPLMFVIVGGFLLFIGYLKFLAR